MKYRDSLLPVLPIHCLWHSQMGAEEKPQQLRILLSWGNACWQISLILILNHAVRSGHNRLNGWWSHPHSPLFLVVSWMFTCVAAGHKFMKLMCCYQSLLVWPYTPLFFFLFSSQPSARAFCCIQMIVRGFSEGINNDRAGFISKGHAESVSRSDFFLLKLVSLEFTLKWLTFDLLELT